MSLSASRLYDENSFYPAFLKDLEQCQKEVIIESPYITASRIEILYPILDKLLKNRVKVFIVTRDPTEHEDEYLRHHATNEILYCSELGINVVLLKGFHHRKLAIIDKKVLWEGSLNILSQSNSLEIMRRIEDREITLQLLKFLKISTFLNA